MIHKLEKQASALGLVELGSIWGLCARYQKPRQGMHHIKEEGREESRQN
jgi:hypothetical protein